MTAPTPRHVRDPRTQVIDPADLPPEPTSEVPAFVAVPAQARTMLGQADLDPDLFDEALADARAEERLATSLTRCRTAARLVQAACVWADGHPSRPGLADDDVDRHGKETDLLEAVREYEEVEP